jgi:hypothetical protein|tara:strand:+ start:3871 stop:4437 length:567 start_codon:yes stop_codon:yes gene_type:complete
MKININQNFETFTEAILEKAEIFHFNLKELPNVNEFKTDIRLETVFEELFKELNKKTNHCLYWFELDSIDYANKLNILLNNNRKKLGLNKRVVPVINKNTNSNVLYVGIRRGGIRKYDGLTNISGRIIQHLGYYVKGSTQGLQLVHWTDKTDINIKLSVIEFNDLPHEYLNVIEKLVAFKLKPLCGKH